MRSKQGILTIAATLLLIFLMSCSQAGKAGPYYFLDHFNSGSIFPKNITIPGTPTGLPVFVLDEVTAGQKRPALITLADFKITFDVGQLGQAPRLKFGAGMNSTIGSGAVGIVTVEADGNSEVVYRRYINPIDRPEDRRWFDESVDLSKFAGKKVTISFGAGRGPKFDATAAWFLWSNLELD